MSSEHASDIQRRMYNFIVSYMRREGMPPTNRDIVVAVHLQEGNSGSATLKRFFQEKEHDRIRLQPANSELEPIFVSRSEWDQEWQVQGKVVAIFRQCPAA